MNGQLKTIGRKLVQCAFDSSKTSNRGFVLLYSHFPVGELDVAAETLPASSSLISTPLFVTLSILRKRV